MINVTKGNTGAISFLHISEAISFAEPKPTIIFIHGFQSAKENNLHYAYLLAEKGFRVILPDCIHHGERDNGLRSNEMMQAFWDIVIQSIYEIELLKNHLLEEKLAEEDSIGVAGTSMGGIITFGALKKYPWIKTAVSLMGSPSYQEFAKWKIEKVAEMGLVLPFNESEIEQYVEQLAKYDLSTDIECMSERPLFCWHGSQDQEVPIEPVLEFINNIKGHYKNKPENIKLIVDDRAEHKVTREGVLATVDWFATHLSSPVKSNS
ncbi:prolyl oligopeptidase family serine peptidase [Sutcliffiella halmapala]|uniref:prolyl oligopeptidase family serine peptidase n=1 Tax=Sutcliffiella halmapala TaxID=79882 RepID=UPI000994A91F|nr:prolyl oligopeptidase family serine peptidase [Sutcliffiella halmapala]